MDYNKNYYKILGVDKNCSVDEIKKSFRNLSKIHHPDKGGDSNVFKEINEANSILSDSQKKNNYDNLSPHGKSYRNNQNTYDNFKTYNDYYSNPFESFNTRFGDDIEDFLRRSGFNTTYQKEIIEDLDIEVLVNLSLDDIYNNNTKEFSYIRNIPCNTCNGSGEVDMDGHISCNMCNGKGKILMRNGNESICTNCKGSGKITKKVCDSCKGSKLIQKKEIQPLSNLFMVNDKQQIISFPNLGHYSKYYKGRLGKLIIILNPIANDKYNKNRYDLYYKTKIDFKTAILGGNLEYEHLDGKIYSIKIPEKTNTGSRFKLKGKGMLVDLNTRGDLFIDTEIYIDYDKLTEADIEKFK